MKTNIIKNSNIIISTSPIFMSLVMLWNVASGSLYTNYVIIGGFVLGIIGIWRAIVN